MKQLLKPLLILVVVLAVFYASSPWWLPVILAKQLPPGWQLETLKMSWPGFSGVNLKHAEARGKLPGLTLTIEVENSRLSYQGLVTTIDSAKLHIYLPPSKDKPPVPFSIDDLSLPMFQLSASLPSVTVNQAQLALHFASDNPDDKSDQPVVIALQGFHLDPSDQGHYQLDTTASIVGQGTINGHFNVYVNPEKLSALVRFPADETSPAWLDVAFTQVDDPDTTESELDLQFDADAAGDEWLDALLSKSTQGRLTHVGGQLQAQVVFNGDQIRHFSQMSLKANRFQVDFDGDTAVINTHIQAKREAQTVLVEFTDSGDSATGDVGAGRLSLLDRSGQIETVLANSIPELKRSNGTGVDSFANAELRITPASQLVLNLPVSTLAKPSLKFSGGLALDYSTDKSSILLKLDEVNIGIADLEPAAQFDLTGGLSLNWKEQGPFAYATETLSVAANSLSLQASGKLAWAPEQISFQPTGKIDALLPGLKAKIQTGEPSAPGWIEFVADNLQASEAQLGFNLIGNPDNDSTISYLFKGPLQSVNPKITVFSPDNPLQTVVTAGELNMTGSLESDENQLKSSGAGYLTKANIMPLAANASRLDLKWVDLDLANLTGAVDVKTGGFKIKVKENTWTGFDLDTKLKLLKDDNIKGNGNLSFNGNAGLPIEFSGNTKSGWWDVSLLNSTIPLAGLRAMLRSAHIELPADLKLAGGSLSVSGLIQVHDDISAKLDLSGSEISADLAESNARQASFKFDSGYNNDIFASGPVAIQHMELAGGIDIADFGVEVKLENSHTFELSKLSANLFDGQLKIDKLNYADGEIEDTAINLTHINLQKLFAFLDMEGLEGTGFIDFHLPAGSHGSAIHIIDGTFTSTGPGRLAYSKGSMASTNIGLLALDNFHYKELSGKIAYDSAGPYKITIHLDGSNPDLYNGYPVIFNLTINGSLPELFEAMFLTGSFEESILKQIKIK